jgi:HK97 family phage major capsid protein
MATVSELIAANEATLGQKQARFDEVMGKSIAAGRAPDEAEHAECMQLKGEIEGLDSYLSLLRFQEKGIAATATPIAPKSSIDATGMRLSGHRNYATAKDPKPEPGVRLARYVRCKALARLEQADAARIAEREYGSRDPVLVEFIKAGEVAAVSTGAGGDGFIPAEMGFGDFADYLRPMTILGKFGTGNIPALRRVPFRSGLVSMATGSTGYWVGEAKPKPVTLVDSNRTHLLPLKVAAIIVTTMELIRDSSPSAEAAIRQDMTEAIVATLDTTFIDPAVTASAGVSPASITNDQDAIASTGTDADAIRLDLRSLFAKFEAANNMASQAVLVMSTTNARAAAFLTNALGQPEFPAMTAMGGSLMGIPVIASDHADDNVVLISAGDVYVADEGGVAIDMSTEASVEMKTNGQLAQHADATATGAAMVSLWQGNLVGFRAERTMNWVKRRAVCAPYLTGVAWGEAVVAS